MSLSNSKVTLPVFKNKFNKEYEKLIPKSRQEFSFKDLKITNKEDTIKLKSIFCSFNYFIYQIFILFYFRNYVDISWW